MPGRKIALIVGASRGIGKAIALRLADDGFDVVATCRDHPEKMDAIRGEIEVKGAAFTALAFDVADRQAAANALLGYFGNEAPDVLVYNAGVSADNLFVFMTSAEWDKVLHTNTDGFYNCVQPLLLGMMARKSGRIIAISSASGQTGQAGQVNYSASKAALIGAVKALAREVGRKNILVNAIAPGFIDTDMTKDILKEKLLSLIPLNRSGSPEEVASAVSFLAGPDGSYVHGQVIGVNGGLVI